jgi:hypothetical protein
MAKRINAKASAAKASQAIETASQASKASTPVKAGEMPSNIKPHTSFEACMATATEKIDALIRGGASAVTFISSALLVGYLSRNKIKLSVMRDEFSLALKKKGLGGTQTKKYLDYGMTLANKMFNECKFGMEMAALLAADNPDKAHDAVMTWVTRHTKAKKTEHGFKLDQAGERLNVLGVFLGMEDDPEKPETLSGTETPDEKKAKARKSAADAIVKDTAILKQVPVETLATAVGQVVSFTVLIRKHAETLTTVQAVEKELAEITESYKARIKALKQNIGKSETAPKTSQEPAAA